MRRRVISVFVAAALATTAFGQVEFLDETFEYDRDQPAAGLWVGNLHVQDQWWYGVLHIKHNDEEGWSARGIVVPPEMSFVAVGAECRDIEITNGHAELTVPGQIGGTARLVGDVSDDGQRWMGTITQNPPSGDPIEGEFEFARTPQVVDLPRPMAFTGQIEVQGVLKLDMTLAFAQTPKGNWVGHVDVPAQMTHGFVLADLTREDRTFTGVMLGLPPAYINVELDETERRITGTMKQGGFVLDIDFARHDGYVGSELKRPQHPKPPYPYAVRDVTITHPDGHTLAGTLTIPDTNEYGAGPFPTAVLITGSGPQDRDESLLGHKPFLVIADYLTRHGITVMRYDDRGTAQSSGTFSGATSADFATDVVAVMDFLKTQSDVDADRIGLIGHSEGGLIAPTVVTMTDDIAFLVLLAGPGVPGRELLAVQRELLTMATGASEEDAQKSNQQFAEIERTIQGGADEEQILEFLVKIAREQDPDNKKTDEELAEIVKPQAKTLMSPWFRYFMDYDPAEALRNLKCPVLALNGTLDLQVWHEQNLDAIERIMTEAGGDITAKRYEGLNHLFQPATTGSVGEYAQIETTFDEQVLRDIVDWIKLKTGG